MITEKQSRARKLDQWNYLLISQEVLFNVTMFPKVLKSLSDMKYPDGIEGSFSIAERYAQEVSDAVKKIEGSITRTDHIAYVQTSSSVLLAPSSTWFWVSPKDQLRWSIS